MISAHLVPCVKTRGYGALPHVERSEGYPKNQATLSEFRNRTYEGVAVALSVLSVAGQVVVCLDAASRPEKHCFNRE